MQTRNLKTKSTALKLRVKLLKHPPSLTASYSYINMTVSINEVLPKRQL